MLAAMRNGIILIASVWLFLGAVSYTARDGIVHAVVIVVALILTAFVLFDLLITVDGIRKNKKQ